MAASAIAVRSLFALTLSSIPAATVLYTGIIDPNITLRVEPVGTFTGLEMVIEYSYMYANPTGPAYLVVPLSYAMRRFTASRPIAVATIDYVYLNAVTGTTTNLTFEQWFRFDNYSRIVAADFTIDRFAEYTSALGLDDVIAAVPSFPTLLKNIVCQAALNYCRLPPLQQYTDMQTCMDFLSTVPLVNTLRIQSNTVLCRYWHAALLAVAPAVHCPHVGVSGGGMCVDEPYSTYYSASPFAVGTFGSQ
ncbi:hypothetical protein PLESTF_000544000 [Pleodorina starrii]|nr:hypothetical protein PLESTF_000544000 [Pleodorina starrii]